MKTKFIFFALCFLCFLQTIYCQSTKTNNENISSKEISTSANSDLSDLNDLGIAFYDKSFSLSGYDIYLIKNFDFNQYRNYNSRRNIQITNGPVIVLFSLKEMMEAGTKIDMDLLNSKMNVDNSGVTHDMIVLVNIGMGVTNAIEPK